MRVEHRGDYPIPTKTPSYQHPENSERERRRVGMIQRAVLLQRSFEQTQVASKELRAVGASAPEQWLISL